MKSPDLQLATVAHETLDVGDAYRHLDSRLLTMLHEASLAIAGLREPTDIGQRIVAITETLMPVEARILAAVYLADDGPRLLAHGARGHDGDLLGPDETGRIQAALLEDDAEGVVARVLRTGRTERGGNAAEVPEFIDVFGEVRSFLCVPAITQGTVVGAINVESTFPDVFGDREATALAIIANQLAVALENARLLAAANLELERRREAEERLRSLNEQLGVQASRDDLTGLINRREFMRRLARAQQTAHRVGAIHALCLVDLDGFKQVNDTAGHAGGDQLLTRIADRLSAVARKRDTVARIGGDEFALLLEHCTSRQAQRLAEGLRRVVEELRETYEGQVFKVSASIGVVSMDAGARSVGQIMREADVACYAAKQAGGNRVHTSELVSDLISMRDRENRSLLDVENALSARGGLNLFAQPILEFGPGAPFARVEILARLRTVDGRLLLPKDFLGVVERFHLAPKLDQRVLTEALAWLQKGGELEGRPIVANVNVSGQTLGDAGFSRHAERCFARSSVEPDRICFEITETAMIGDLSRAQQFIEQMRALGCHFAIDDFGTGFSSISYLRDLRVQWLKIDGSFVQGLRTNEQDGTLVTMINDVAHCFGARTVAEWVETDEDLERVRAIGVDAVQGFRIGRPYPTSGPSAGTEPS